MQLGHKVIHCHVAWGGNEDSASCMYVLTDQLNHGRRLSSACGQKIERSTYEMRWNVLVLLCCLCHLEDHV